MDKNHFSLADLVVAATVFGVTGILLVLLANVDFLSPEFFLGLCCPVIFSWCTTSFQRSLSGYSGTSEGHVTVCFRIPTIVSAMPLKGKES